MWIWLLPVDDEETEGTSWATADQPPTPHSPVTSASSSTEQPSKRNMWESAHLIFFQLMIDNLLGRCFEIVKVRYSTCAKAQEWFCPIRQSKAESWILIGLPLFWLMRRIQRIPLEPFVTSQPVDASSLQKALQIWVSQSAGWIGAQDLPETFLKAETFVHIHHF